MFLKFSVFLCLFVVCILNPTSTLKALGNQPGGGEKPDSGTAPSRTARAKFEVDFRVAIVAPAKTKKLRVWIPIPPTTGNQVVTNSRFRTFPRKVSSRVSTEPTYGNEFAYFEIESPDGALEIQHTFTAEIAQVDWSVDYAKVVKAGSWPEKFEVFQKPDARSSRATDYQHVVGQILSVSDRKSKQLMKAIEWVDQNLTYDSANASLTADPAHGLIHRRGHCSDYHGLCGTFAREIGFPSRVLYGLQMFEKGSPSHCKLEVYLPPYGWVTYDLSETQKLALKIQANGNLTAEQQTKMSKQVRQRTLNGFRENTWLLVTRGENYPLAPAASTPVSVLRTIHAEADGIALKEGASMDSGTWMTMQRVEEIGSAGRRFSVLNDQP